MPGVRCCTHASTEIKMIDILNAIADFFLSVLKGILSFFREVIPLLLKVFFVSSPFVLAIFTAYVIGGVLLTGIAVVGTLLFIGLGIFWAERSGTKESTLTPGVIASVLIMDLILVSLIAMETDWKGWFKNTSTSQEPIRENTKMPGEGEPLTPIPHIKASPDAEIIIVTGKWVGKLDDASSTLNISEQNGSSFKGTLTKYDSNTYIIAISGSLNSRTRQVSIIETQVIQEPSSGAWSLGVNEGSISNDGKIINGRGKDKRGKTYSWSYSKS
jgi:hypothetical protein